MTAGKTCATSLIQMVFNMANVGVTYLNRHGKETDSRGIEMIRPVRIIAWDLFAIAITCTFLFFAR
jgi:hypothetical protein